MKDLPLGAKVHITGTVVKVKQRTHNYSKVVIGYEEGPPPTRCNYPDDKVFTEGVIVGSRTIQDGEAFWEDGSSYYQPTAGTARNVWLVAFDMRMKPVMCLDDQVMESGR